MKNLILPFMIMFPIIGYCQYNLNFSQRINTLEIINPGYNASKKNLSATFMTHFKKLDDNFYVGGHLLNLNVPIPKWNIGFGTNFFTESNEFDSKINLDLSTCVDVKITRNSSLGFGLMGGLESNEEEYNPYAQGQVFENRFNIHGGFGLNFASRDLELGAAVHYNQLSENIANQSEHYTLFLNGSYLFELDADLDLKPSVLYQYRNKTNVIDYGLSVTYEDCFTLGIYNRWDQSLILYFHLKVFPWMHFGYSAVLAINKDYLSDYGYVEIMVKFILPSKNRKGKYTLFGG
ncbi:MAG: type IX secretion system membrane protein PorP/SprF [Prolixibacteraceae bacterium]|nr:type IX secretion system membrane protein PorP/SprF [Prolixibacteraceae bacterium]